MSLPENMTKREISRGYKNMHIKVHNIKLFSYIYFLWIIIKLSWYLQQVPINK